MASPALTAPRTPPTQSPEEIANLLDSFLAEHPGSVLLEDGRVLFDLRQARYTVSTDHDRCTVHLWSEDRNLTRRILSATGRNGVLRLATQRFGHARPTTLELAADPDRRTASTRETTRTGYLRLLARVLERQFPDLKPEGFRTAMDLERSFGPAYARGSLVRGQTAWAVVSVNPDETQVTVDGILTVGILWLAHCRAAAEASTGLKTRRLYTGLKLILPAGTASLTLSRLPWLDPALAAYELYELDSRSEDLERRDPTDAGNLQTRLAHAPDLVGARIRFAEAIPAVLALLPPGTPVYGLNLTPSGRPALNQPNPNLATSGEVEIDASPLAASLPAGATPPASWLQATSAPAHSRHQLLPNTPACELRLRSSTHLAFLLHGLEFARIRQGYAGQSFNRQLETTVGAGPNETPLTPETEPHLRELIRQLFSRRTVSPGAKPDPRDPLFRLHPERWLESLLRQDLPSLDTRLAPAPVYTQVPAFTGGGAHADRGMLDLLAVTHDGQLALIELKAEEDLHLALQGLDYWIRVRHHHLAEVDPVTGLGDLQRHGYFPHQLLRSRPPRLLLVAPALRIHPATETILRYLSPEIPWELIALDERWRTQITPVWRKRSAPPGPGTSNNVPQMRRNG